MIELVSKHLIQVHCPKPAQQPYQKGLKYLDHRFNLFKLDYPQPRYWSKWVTIAILECSCSTLKLTLYK